MKHILHIQNFKKFKLLSKIFENLLALGARAVPCMEESPTVPLCPQQCPPNRGLQQQCLGTLPITPCQLRHSYTKSFPGWEPERFYFAYRIHEKNAKEEVKAQEHMERRIQAVLSLKTSITSNRVLLLGWAGNEVTALGDCWVLMQVSSVCLAELGGDFWSDHWPNPSELGGSLTLGGKVWVLCGQILTLLLMQFILSTV